MVAVVPVPLTRMPWAELPETTLRSAASLEPSAFVPMRVLVAPASTWMAARVLPSAVEPLGARPTLLPMRTMASVPLPVTQMPRWALPEETLSRTVMRRAPSPAVPLQLPT